MSRIIQTRNVNEAFADAVWWMRTAGVREQSRNGQVLVAPGLVVTEYSRPWERVLFSPVRDANPVFHLMEAIWMLAGRDDSEWLEQFNSNYANYADDGVVHGAYGARWRRSLSLDQLYAIVEVLRNDPTSRQAVLQMWDVNCDDLLGRWKDRPCNTHAYFDLRNGVLNMTVCCRSNDVLWGAYGANVVHFSILQEVLAAELGVEMGTYRQVSNNFHLYTDNQIVKTLLASPPYDTHDYYGSGKADSVSFVLVNEKMQDILEDCERFCEGVRPRTFFLSQVAAPLRDAYLSRKNGGEYSLNRIPQCDWKIAFQEWIKRRELHVRADS